MNTLTPEALCFVARLFSGNEHWSTRSKPQLFAVTDVAWLVNKESSILGLATYIIWSSFTDITSGRLFKAVIVDWA
jgi:hypothetical protein